MSSSPGAAIRHTVPPREWPAGRGVMRRPKPLPGIRNDMVRCNILVFKMLH